MPEQNGNGPKGPAQALKNRNPKDLGKTTRAEIGRAQTLAVEPIAKKEPSEKTKPEPVERIPFSLHELQAIFKPLGYQLQRQIGKGGMGRVYEAYSGRAGIPKKVAIKVLQIDDDSVRTRFLDEANLMRKIKHPCVVTIHESNITRGIAFLVMDFLTGVPLSTPLGERKGKGLNLELAMNISFGMCSALAQAHRLGIIHRDIKPGNIFLMRTPDPKINVVKVIDFGLARIINMDYPDAPRLTIDGSVLGTPQYIAPEVIRGGEYDHRIDIYSTGVTMYEMISGSLPFRADNRLSMLYMHVHEKPQPMRERRPDLNIPENIEAIVMKALEKDPKDRFKDMEEMKKAIEECGVVIHPIADVPVHERVPMNKPDFFRKALMVATLAVATAAAGVYHKESIKSYFTPRAAVIAASSQPMKADAGIDALAKPVKEEIYQAKFESDPPGALVWEEEKIEGGTVVPRFIGKTPVEVPLTGKRTVYFEMEGHKRAYYHVSQEFSAINHKMINREKPASQP